MISVSLSSLILIVALGQLSLTISNLASNLISNLEEIQSYKISCPEEVAYKNGWIDKEQLSYLATTFPKGEYRDYLNLLLSYE